MKNFFSYALRTISVLAAVVPTTAYAQTQGKLINPLQSPNVSSFVSSLLQIVVTISFPIIVLAFVYVGFLFIAAQGNQAKLQKAKSNLMYVIAGAALILGAWTLATLIGATVSQFVGT